MTNLEQLMTQWVQAKEDELLAQTQRRAIEEQLQAAIDLPADFAGAKTIEQGGYRCKAVARIDRKVDADLLQEVAAEAGLTDTLSTAFRWKAEINSKAWASLSADAIGIFNKAITSKQSKPTFSITKEV